MGGEHAIHIEGARRETICIGLERERERERERYAIWLAVLDRGRLLVSLRSPSRSRSPDP